GMTRRAAKIAITIITTNAIARRSLGSSTGTAMTEADVASHTVVCDNWRQPSGAETVDPRHAQSIRNLRTMARAAAPPKMNARPATNKAVNNRPGSSSRATPDTTSRQLSPAAKIDDRGRPRESIALRIGPGLASFALPTKRNTTAVVI